jgi:hypothetical protein
MVGFIDQHPQWDQYRLMQLTLAGFLFQQGCARLPICRQSSYPQRSSSCSTPCVITKACLIKTVSAKGVSAEQLEDRLSALAASHSQRFDRLERLLLLLAEAKQLSG